MTLFSRFCLLASLSYVPAIAACGSDNAKTSCDDHNLCSPGYVCIGGQCQLDNTGYDGGDGNGTSDGDNGDANGDGGDGDGDIALTDEDTTAGDAVIVDTAGPVVSINSPVSDQMVGAHMSVSFTATDDSGLQSGGVSAFVGATASGRNRVDIPLAQDDSGAFTAIFDTIQLGTDFTFPYFGVRAVDALGNETDVGFHFSIDNTPPRVGFSSSDVQAVNTQGYCSMPWNPLGDVATNYRLADGVVYNNINAIPRLRIEDEGNFRPPVGVYSGIDQARSKLYFLAYHNGIPKLVQASRGMGAPCDTINPDVLPNPQPRLDEAVVYDLVPFTQSHAPYFPQSGGSGPVCTPSGTDQAYPGDVCLGGAPVAHIPHWLTYGLGDPAVWGIEGYVGKDYSVFCSGGVFDTYNLPPGPACAAAAVTDNVGNVTVTLPIAICVARGGTECDNFDSTMAETVRTACGSHDCTAPDWSSVPPTEEFLE